MPNANSALRDRAIRHALQLQSYGRQLSQDIVRLLNTGDEALVDKIATRLIAIDDKGLDTSPATTARLKALLAEMRAINAEIYARMGDHLTGELQDFAQSQAEFQKASLDKATQAPALTSLPSPDLIRTLVTHSPIQGALLSSWIDTAAGNRADRIEGAIRQGILEGQSTDDIARAIRGTKALQYRDGILDISRRGAQTMARTSVTSIANVASQATWRVNSRVVDAWQFLATLDNRTTMICASLDGTTYPVGEGPMPPRHLSCRSISVAVTKSWRDLGIDAESVPPRARASMDGQVAGGTTFETWLRGKDAGTQNQVLGRTRADLFRQDKLNLQDFVSKDGSTLTLEQLKKAHSSILS